MILDGNVISMSLIILEGKYVAIDTDDSWCHGYYIIKFSSSPYNLQVYLSIDGQVISSGEIIFEGTYFIRRNNLPINNQVYLKVIWRWRKLDNIVTMTWRIMSINSIIFSFKNY